MASREQQLYRACEAGDAATVSGYLHRPSLQVNETNLLGWSPLHVAARWGHTQAVRTLAQDPRVEVNLQDSRGYTPLMVACLNGKVEIVEELLRCGAVDLTLRNSTGLTSTNIAVTGSGKIGIVKWMLACRRIGERDVEDTLQVALAKGETSQVVVLLRKYLADPENVTYALRKELGSLGELISGEIEPAGAHF